MRYYSNITARTNLRVVDEAAGYLQLLEISWNFINDAPGKFNSHLKYDIMPISDRNLVSL